MIQAWGQTTFELRKTIATIEKGRLLESTSTSKSESIIETVVTEILLVAKEGISIDQVSPSLRSSPTESSPPMATIDWFKTGDGNILKSWGEVEREKARLRR